MNILVTGGAGFIGSHYVRMLIQGAGPDDSVPQVTVLDKLTYAGNRANLTDVEDNVAVRFVHGDITDRPLVHRLMADVDTVVHCAAESHVDRSLQDADPFVVSNVLGTHVLLEAAVRHGVRTFVQVSTDEVYGSITRGSWDESRPLMPNSQYSASKASADLLALACHRTHGLDVRVTRCSNNYGPMQFPEKLIPFFVTRLLDARTVPLYGDGHHVREWLHVEDHCRGIDLVRLRGRPGHVYHLGGGTELSNRQITRLLLDECGADWSAVRHVPDRKGHDRRYSLDWTKARRELGYRPRRDFTEGLAETVQWYRDHADHWRPAASPGVRTNSRRNP